MRITAKIRADAERRRAIARALSHDETLLVERALDAYADMLLAADRVFPNPDQRALAQRARDLAEQCQRADAVRGLVEEQS